MFGVKAHDRPKKGQGESLQPCWQFCFLYFFILLDFPRSGLLLQLLAGSHWSQGPSLHAQDLGTVATTFHIGKQPGLLVPRMSGLPGTGIAGLPGLRAPMVIDDGGRALTTPF